MHTGASAEQLSQLYLINYLHRTIDRTDCKVCHRWLSRHNQKT